MPATADAAASTTAPARRPRTRTRRARRRSARDWARIRALSAAARTRCRWTWFIAFSLAGTSAAERTLGRRNFVGRTRIDRDRGAQSARQALEAGLGDMVVVGAVERRDVQRHPAVRRERLEPLLHQLGIEAADLVAYELGLEHEERPAGNVERDAGERLVHGHMDVGVAGDALHVAERLFHRLPERDPDVLGGVVMIEIGR